MVALPWGPEQFRTPLPVRQAVWLACCGGRLIICDGTLVGARSVVDDLDAVRVRPTRDKLDEAARPPEVVLGDLDAAAIEDRQAHVRERGAVIGDGDGGQLVLHKA